MLNTLLSCHPESTLQSKFDYRQVTFPTSMFNKMKYFWITLCSWKRISEFIICYFSGLSVFRYHPAVYSVLPESFAYVLPEQFLIKGNTIEERFSLYTIKLSTFASKRDLFTVL